MRVTNFHFLQNSYQSFQSFHLYTARKERCVYIRLSRSVLRKGYGLIFTSLYKYHSGDYAIPNISLFHRIGESWFINEIGDLLEELYSLFLQQFLLFCFKQF